MRRRLDLLSVLLSACQGPVAGDSEWVSWAEAARIIGCPRSEALIRATYRALT